MYIQVENVKISGNQAHPGEKNCTKLNSKFNCKRDILFIYLFIYLFQAPTPTPTAQTLSTDTREIMVTIGDVPYPISPTADAFEEIVLPESVEQDLAREPEGEPGSICEYYQVLKIHLGRGVIGPCCGALEGFSQKVE